MTEQTADDALAYLAITRLQAAYADVVTRRAWAELDELFLPEAPVHVDTVTNPVIELVGPQALGRFIDGAIERFEFFEFVPLNTVVDVEGDAATARLYMVELRQDRDGGRWSNAFGLYQDRYERTTQGWRFAERHYQSLARTSPATVVFPYRLRGEPDEGEVGRAARPPAGGGRADGRRGVGRHRP